MVNDRKTDHIDLAFRAQLSTESKDQHFFYEPLFGTHPTPKQKNSMKFLGHEINHPLWISSMTGGALKAAAINKNLATMARDFKIPMGLGSTRPLLDSNQFFEDFNIRPILGNDVPFYINLGIAQVEKLIDTNQTEKIHELVQKLSSNGLIIHINPMQEWFQPEGDRYKQNPLETLTKFLMNKKYPVIVKEVGQGMGPRSLKALLDLKVDAIEFGAFGGTNFSLLESLRRQTDVSHLSSTALTTVGHSPIEMIGFLNELTIKNKSYLNTEVIISGGISHALEGQYYRSVLKSNSVIGLASRCLRYAHDIEMLERFFIDEIETLMMAHNFLTAKEVFNETH